MDYEALPVIYHRRIAHVDCLGRLDLIVHEGAMLEIRCDECNVLIAIATLDDLDVVMTSLRDRCI